MKWPKRTAQGFSPGFAAEKIRPEVSTELGRVASGVYYVVFNGLIRVEPIPSPSPPITSHLSPLTSHLK
jgi:hypothetical protein